MATNLRLEAKPLRPQATQQDRDENFKGLLHAFMRQSGPILREVRNRQYFETERERILRKRREKAESEARTRRFKSGREDPT